MSNVLECKEIGNVLTVTLHRPEVRNAMNLEMMRALTKTFHNISSQCRAVVLRGHGDFFCAGGDLHWMKSSVEKSKDENEKDALELAKMMRAVDECPVPVITEVKGGAFGGGVGLVAASDIVIAEDSALFSLSEVKLGLIPATIGPLVMRKIGVSEARRLYLLGKRFSATEAKAIHLIHDVVPKGTLFSATKEVLRELSTSGPEAVRRGKKLIKEMMGPSLWNDDIAETTSKILSEVRVGQEAQSGLQAFLQKSKAPWVKDLLSE